MALAPARLLAQAGKQQDPDPVDRWFAHGSNGNQRSSSPFGTMPPLPVAPS
jgi:hypothetical protein